MPDRTWLIRVDHMVDFIDRIERYVASCSKEEFLSHGVCFDAVCRNLELLGEAASHIPQAVKDAYPDLPWYEMRGLRNVLAHDYMGADELIIWATATRAVGPLKAQLLELKRKEDHGDSTNA